MLPPSLLVISRGWGPIDLPLRATSSPAHPLADIFHPPYPPIASQSISRDVPVARARALLFPLPISKGVAKAALYCAQHSHPPNPERAMTRSFPKRAQLYRARSASKEGTWPLPPHPSQAARCASTEDHQAPYPNPTSSIVYSPWNGTRFGPTAPVERAHSDCARSGSKGSTGAIPFYLLGRVLLGISHITVTGQ